MKEINKDLKISQWFLDPLSKLGPDHESNTKRILDKIDIIDSSFLTTFPSALNSKFQIHTLYPIHVTCLLKFYQTMKRIVILMFFCYEPWRSSWWT